ncbi:fatty acid biosynthesis transcriptional regulator [Salipaludibacillus neizhouensis]|uniref:Transcription factor FapR n=1 Tax=Salipaludibacillus neizhouensis TaxID=885475 RepID=A0A3A9KBG9_9BACI|nr:transcription factor FapR [Salipaludibacillus neizhouensis]RKL68958.1 fatty acid biosynthesis transcriptional regulator [Salipaludibacillus neizhouensis]
MKLSKRKRQPLLKEKIEQNPFITDDVLAVEFEVSVQTVRLDRLEMNIPEVRERIKYVAKQQYDTVKALPIEEVIGEMIDLELDSHAISILDIKREHVFSRTGIARGHHIFAQANSLAVAIINDELALTAQANVSFKSQVNDGERVVAKAKVLEIKDNRTIVEVQSYVEQELVFKGEFSMFRDDANEGKES